MTVCDITIGKHVLMVSKHLVAAADVATVSNLLQAEPSVGTVV